MYTIKKLLIKLNIIVYIPITFQCNSVSYLRDNNERICAFHFDLNINNNK